MSNWPFRYQILLLGLIPALFTWISLTINTLYSSWETLDRTYRQHGQTIAHLIAPSTEFSLFSGDLGPLQQRLQQHLSDTHIERIEIYDHDLHLLMRVGPTPPPTLTPDTTLQFSATILPTIEEGVPTTPLGSVTITLSQQPLLEQRNQIIQQALWVGGAALLLTLVVSATLSMHLTRLFQRIRSAMRQIGNGDFSPPKQPLPTEGELGELTQDLHRMAASLERNRQATLAAYELMEPTNGNRLGEQRDE